MNSHEVSAAYVFRMPMRKSTPFVLAGASSQAQLMILFDRTRRRGSHYASRRALTGLWVPVLTGSLAVSLGS